MVSSGAARQRIAGVVDMDSLVLAPQRWADLDSTLLCFLPEHIYKYHERLALNSRVSDESLRQMRIEFELLKQVASATIRERSSGGAYMCVVENVHFKIACAGEIYDGDKIRALQLIERLVPSARGIVAQCVKSAEQLAMEASDRQRRQRRADAHRRDRRHSASDGSDGDTSDASGTSDRFSNNSNSSSASAQTSASTQTSASGSVGGVKRWRGKCWTCRQVGHVAKLCPIKSRATKAGATTEVASATARGVESATRAAGQRRGDGAPVDQGQRVAADAVGDERVGKACSCDV
jgi:hypothetical protein